MSNQRPCDDRGHLPAQPGLRQTAGMTTPRALLLLATAVLACLLWRTWRSRGRQRAREQAVRGLLDAADALEERLRIARGEIEAVAGDHENPVRGAMQDLLRQRLWLQQHGGAASLQQLHDVRASLDTARDHLERQLRQLSLARGGASG